MDDIIEETKPILKILIIEDSPNDIRYYSSLFDVKTEVSFVFLNKDKNYTKEKLFNLIENSYERLASKIKEYYVMDETEIAAFLKNNVFDFYISDSLGGTADIFIDKAKLSKERVAFLSSTTSFRESVWDKGYRAYKKENIDELIRDCF